LREICIDKSIYNRKQNYTQQTENLHQFDIQSDLISPLSSSPLVEYLTNIESELESDSDELNMFEQYTTVADRDRNQKNNKTKKK